MSLSGQESRLDEETEILVKQDRLKKWQDSAERIFDASFNPQLESNLRWVTWHKVFS